LASSSQTKTATRVHIERRDLTNNQRDGRGEDGKAAKALATSNSSKSVELPPARAGRRPHKLSSKKPPLILLAFLGRRDAPPNDEKPTVWPSPTLNGKSQFQT